MHYHSIFLYLNEWITAELFFFPKTLEESGKETMLLTFFLVMEALSVKEDLSVIKGDIKLSNTRCTTPLAHLILADVLVFCRANTTSLRAVKEIFLFFSYLFFFFFLHFLSGLPLDKEKTNLPK